jgi:hypothetical protein
LSVYIAPIMSYKLTLDEIKKAERKIGNKVSRIVEKAIIREIENYNLGSNNTSKESLRNSIKSKPIMGDVRLFRISTTMARHGFILQHGATKRSGHVRKMGKWKNERESGGKNKKAFYSVKEHTFMLSSRPFIEEGIKNSGAFEVLFKELGALRFKEIAIVFDKLDIKIT